jgi:hypothetical protein
VWGLNRVSTPAISGFASPLQGGGRRFETTSAHKQTCRSERLPMGSRPSPRAGLLPGLLSGAYRRGFYAPGIQPRPSPMSRDYRGELHRGRLTEDHGQDKVEAHTDGGPVRSPMRRAVAPRRPIRASDRGRGPRQGGIRLHPPARRPDQAEQLALPHLPASGDQGGRNSERVSHRASMTSDTRPPRSQHDVDTRYTRSRTCWATRRSRRRLTCISISFQTPSARRRPALVR